MNRGFLPASAMLLLLACERGAPEAENKNSRAANEDYQARLQAMPEAQRNAVFIRAIRDAGQECQHVQRSAPGGEINGAPAWTAACDNGVQWTIAIRNNGVAQVMSTAELQAVAARMGNQAK